MNQSASKGKSGQLSGKEVGDLWEKMRYVGANNSYLFFHELDDKGLLNAETVRIFLGASKEVRK